MMALQSITELNSYSSFSDILFLVCLCLCLSHVYVIVFVFPIFTMTSMHFPKLRHCPRQKL